MDLGFRGKTVIITGGAKGMGRAYCQGFATEGANVCVFDLDESGAGCVVKEITKVGGVGAAFVTDVASYESVLNSVGTVLNKFGRIDILVNNAGIRLLALLEETTEEIWDSQMNVNLRGVFNTCKAVVPHFKRQRYGKILNISSVAGKRGHVLRGSAYAATKGGVIALTKSIAREVASYNINVNSLAPSIIQTDFMKDFSEQEMTNIKKLIPLGRVGQPTDLVGIALLLCSDAGSFIHGDVINVDGGQFMG